MKSGRRVEKPTLVDHERSLSVVDGVLVRRGDDPRRSVCIEGREVQMSVAECAASPFAKNPYAPLTPR